ncbi:unnamed protein product [Phytophthora lilii]|uniref:Unnamed protein product n=1 Tax=Phytophthora lilii TaxID=2077276 RepID=A0A9W6WR71_9STRA|nr:unnamed protein product [Phytophthora lilii]
MQLYVYAPEHGSPLDFCVRQNKDNTNEYVICDVKKDGIAYGAGARAGDRVQAYSKVQSLGYKKFRKWEPETLNELNMETQRQLIVLSVDKRVPLRKEEEKHALTRKHRLSFMRVRSTLNLRLSSVAECGCSLGCRKCLRRRPGSSICLTMCDYGMRCSQHQRANDSAQINTQWQGSPRNADFLQLWKKNA